jgi:hypothetical protein
MLAMMSVYYLWFLFIDDNHWIVAGNIVNSVADDLAMERRKILVIDLPDNLRGAFIYRNGFENSFKVMQRFVPQTITVLSKKEFDSDFNLQSGANDNDRFLITNSNEGFEIKDRQKGTSYNINSKDEALYIFDRGHLRLK